MTSSKTMHPALAYLMECRKRGYSCEEASSKLKKAGYSDDAITLSETAYHHKKKTDLFKGVSIVLFVILILSSYWSAITILATRSVVKDLGEEIRSMRSGPSGPQDAYSCLGKPQEVKERCLGYAKEVLVRDEVVAAGDQKAALVAQLAVIDDNFSRCAELDARGEADCDYRAHELSAELSSDPEICEGLPGLPDKVRCYMEALSKIDRVAAEKLRSAVRIAKESHDQSLCNGLGKEFLIESCMRTVLE
ncbi:MAG: hypothetical protein AABX47_03495 [Nanoarchaeota archaeon]